MSLTESSSPPRSGSAVHSSLTGTGTLLRFVLRRDRIRTTAWLLGIGAAAFYFAHAVQVIADTQQALESLAVLFADPTGRMMTGPGFGMEQPTYERFYSSGYVLYLYILIALMSVFTVIRHTRVEEQTGRAELVRANVVGRHATLTSALILTALISLLAGILMWAAAVSAGFAAVGALLTAVGGFAVGIFFAAAAAVAAQLSASSSGAAGMAGGLIGLAFLIRMGGDAAEAGGSTLSWFSPLAWPQQTAPFVDDRWWPLLIPVVLTVVLVSLGYWLSVRRDLAAGMVPMRLGRASARPVLGTPLGLAAHTLKGGLRGWGVALVLTGLMYGSFAQVMREAADDLPAEMAQLFAGDDLILGYIAYMGLFMAVFIAAAGVSGLSKLRGEETHGRAEYLLSSPVSRVVWFGAHLGVLLAGLLLITALVGVGIGATTAASLENDGGSYFGQVVLSSLMHAPAILAVIGLVSALIGWLPRAAAPVGWVVIGFGAVMSTFGTLLDLPDLITSLNLFGHVSEYPVEEISAAPLLWLSAIGATGILVGLAGWNRREINRI